MLIEEISLDQRLNMIWQHDGAPAHNMLAVRALLDDIFSGKWIGTQGSKILWPPRSPDMNVLDFYFWGFLKGEVYKEELNNINDLKNRIVEVCSKIPSSVLKKATTSEVTKRLSLCLDMDGNHFEHLLKYQ